MARQRGSGSARTQRTHVASGLLRVAGLAVIAGGLIGGLVSPFWMKRNEVASPVPLAIRKAYPADVPALADVEMDAAQLFVDAGVLSADHLSPMTSAELTEGCRTGHLLLACEEDQPEAGPVGFALAVEVSWGLHLRELSVRRAWGRRGIGRQLVNAVRALDSARPLTLSTFRDLPWNGPFYARIGFASVELVHLTSEQRRLFDREASGLTLARTWMIAPALREG